jgi:hypothetical protein
LIKDYELEVHYHPGKANIVTDTLSHKAHCNYLPALRAEIITAQRDDEGMGHIKRRMREGDPKVACFREDAEGTL